MPHELLLLRGHHSDRWYSPNLRAGLCIRGVGQRFKIPEKVDRIYVCTSPSPVRGALKITVLGSMSARIPPYKGVSFFPFSFVEHLEGLYGLLPTFWAWIEYEEPPLT